ncbi:hypothetical protein N7471_012347 [Penicillium samsonianum]|uniref:uncharacterized protein n=1 Tax=Penicillium samsonianum TaxID=1882272 RepID=UPI0025484258|nr:uncharacterized protein N7471_012347 [Penicillium samsonianum]KAJ6125030.1 hypothetical protein N7471_012347 [Penicillium samsonianum]
MDDTGGAFQLFGIPAKAAKYLRRSPRIADQQARKAEQEAWSTCGEPSQSVSSDIHPVLRHANFECYRILCNRCSLVIDDCVEMLNDFHLCLDGALNLTGDELKFRIRCILETNKVWARGLKRQQS